MPAIVLESGASGEKPRTPLGRPSLRDLQRQEWGETQENAGLGRILDEPHPGERYPRFPGLKGLLPPAQESSAQFKIPARAADLAQCAL